MNDDARLDDLMKFIEESRTYRTADGIRQEYFKQKVDSIDAQVKKTNGRVDAIEDWQKEVQVKTKDKQDSNIRNQNLILVVATVIMSISAVVILFKR